MSEIERVTIPAFTVFVGYGGLQHAGAGWHGSFDLRFHVYFILFNISLKGAVSFEYGVSFYIQPSAIYSTDGDVVVIDPRDTFQYDYKYSLVVYCWPHNAKVRIMM